MGAVAQRHPIRNEILLQSRHAADERVLPDPGELDDRRATADDDVIPHGHVTR